MTIQRPYLIRTIISSSLTQNHRFPLRTKSTATNQPQPLNRLQTNQDQQLDHLIHHALLHHHLDPILFNKLASVCSRQPTQLINLILGSLILNDQSRSKQYMNQLDPIHYEELYPKLFKLCGLIGRGMGMMRRVVGAIQDHPTLKIHHQLTKEEDSRARLKMIETIEAYIENLIQWSQIHRAWVYLNSFDFGPSIDLPHQVQQIGGPFAKKIRRIKKPCNSFRIWKPNQSAYSSLISIYLILDRPDLAIDLDSKVDLTHMDQPMALIICARSLVSQKRQQQQQLPKSQHQLLPGFINLDQINLPTIPGPITTSVLAKAIYQQNGPLGLVTFLSKLNRTNPAPNRSLLSAWLDILITAGGDDALLEPVELGSWMELIHQEGLLGERELEKYLRHTREWLEIELNQNIQLIHSSQDQSIQSPGFVDPNDPRLGYHQLPKFLQAVYEHHSSPSIESTPHENNLDHQIKPSTIVTSELIRISSLTGTSSNKLTEMIDKEILENQTPIRSSHMIGLIWSKIVERDLMGLDNLVERELRFKYKLVLTGVLTTIILAGLIAIRVPKPMIIKMSQKLMEQCPSTRYSPPPSSQTDVRTDDHQDGSLESYLNLIKVAQSIGDLMMIKDLHELIIKKFGREKLVLGVGLDGDEGRKKLQQVGIDYFRLIFEVYNHFNQPLEAHQEVTQALKLCDFFNLDESGRRHLEDPSDHQFLVAQEVSSTLPQQNYDHVKRFLGSGVLKNYLDFQSITKLFHRHYREEKDDDWNKKDTIESGEDEKVDKSLLNPKKRRKEYPMFLKSILKSKHQIEKKMEELNKLKKVYVESKKQYHDNGVGDGGPHVNQVRRKKEKVDEEWQVKKKEEIEDRLNKLIEASHLNQILLDSFDPFPSPPASAPSRQDHDPSISNKEKIMTCSSNINHPHHNLRWRHRTWSDDLKIILKLIRKLI